MKNVTVTGWVCAVSLAANVAGLGAWMLSSRDDAQERVPAVEMRAELKRGGGLSEETRRLLSETGVENLEALRDRLRAEGFPEELVREVVEQRLWKDLHAKLDAADPAKRRPWWQRTREPLPGDVVRLERLEQQLSDTRDGRMKQLFGEEDEQPDEDVSLAFLSPEKREAMRRLDADYADLRRKLEREEGGVSLESDRKRYGLLYREEEADRVALLTPAEYQEWKLRGDRWRFEQERVAAAELNLSEEKFRKLVDIARQEDAADYKDRELAQEVAEAARAQVLDEDELVIYHAAPSGEFGYLERYVARYDLPRSRILEYLKFERRTMDGDSAAIEKDWVGWLRETKAELVRILGPAALEADLAIMKPLGEMSAILDAAEKTR